jgi:hypothetical protein
MKYYSQTSLDEYYTLDEHLKEEGGVKIEEEPARKSKCNYCILKSMHTYCYLVQKEGRLQVHFPRNLYLNSIAIKL